MFLHFLETTSRNVKSNTVHQWRGIKTRFFLSPQSALSDAVITAESTKSSLVCVARPLARLLEGKGQTED